MKRSIGFLLTAAACAALIAATAACETPTVPEPEETVALVTPTPEPVRAIRISEATDAETLRADISEMPALESVEIDPGMLSNEDIAALIADFPSLAFRYQIAVGTRFVEPNVAELTANDPETGITTEEIATALPYLNSLKTVRLGGRTPQQLEEELKLLPDGMADYSVEIFGQTLPSNAETLDLTETDDPDPETLASALPYLPNLKTVVLGARSDPALPAAFRAAAPALTVDCQFQFTYLDQELNESTETLDLTKIPVTDLDELRRVLTWLPALTHVEMVGCGIDNETMAALRDEFPEKGIVWEISLGFWGPVRTDAIAFTTRSSKSKDEMKYRLTAEKLEPIKYCIELVALDLGHQKIDDISCLKGLTKLQILILADNRITDLSPLSSMHDLVYLELFINRISDVSPLAELKNLKDLNICTNHITDLTPFYSMTSLERLYYSHNDFTKEDHNALQAALPNCVCDRTVWQETEHGWREHERYFWMRSFFQDSPRYK